MKHMYRFAFLPLLAFAAFAQDKPAAVTPDQKPPAEVDEALRKRINEFYQLMKAGAANPALYRKGEAYIAEDTKDFYYAGGKPVIDAFELQTIQYFDDFTHAKAITKCSQKMTVANFPPSEIVVKQPTLWKIENGAWVLYEDPEKRENPTGLRTKVEQEAQKTAERLLSGKPPAAAPDAADPSGILKALPTDPGFIMGKIKPDRAEVTIEPGATEHVQINNGSSGIVLLELGFPVKGIEFTLDHKDLPAGGKAVLTLKAGKEPASGNYYLNIMPTNEVITLKVQAKQK